jgi:hypothetical protein
MQQDQRELADRGQEVGMATVWRIPHKTETNTSVPIRTELCPVPAGRHRRIRL